MTDSYQEYVQRLEEGYAPYAKFVSAHPTPGWRACSVA